jgi:UDP-N-acetylmuramyl pentapeptide phosphotransferase/UDP-N-acetylglucosamine-1-phosphate transferase
MNLTRFEVENHRGRRVPRVLGCWLAPAAVAGTILGATVLPAPAFQWGALAGALMAFGAGLVDDLSPIGPRGVRNHLRELAAGHMTTGILKLIVTVASAILVTALLEPTGGLSFIAAVVVIAGCTNVWNGLDVRPGRALKWFLLVVGVSVAARLRFDVGSAAGAWIASWVALPIDLRERAMLGDAGANLLGFTVGVQLAATLPPSALLPAAIVAIALNVVADTLTFSRIIVAVPPIRWFDQVGRLPD